MLNQIITVTSINLRSIPQRLWLSLATVSAIAFMVGVLMGFQAMAGGLQSTLDTGSENVAVVLREGSSRSELNSGLSREQWRLLEEAPGVARGADGEPMASGELYVIADGIKRGETTPSNLPLRGVTPLARDLRDRFDMIEGRFFEPGTNELIVGRGVVAEYQGFEIGDTIRLGVNEWIVVGIFSTGGTVFDGEIWADLPVIQNLYQRGTGVQSVRLALTDTGTIDGLIAYADTDPRLTLDIATEREFFSGQAANTIDLIRGLGMGLAIAMAIGAIAGAWNTMYSSVDTRTREIATLRAIGFNGLVAAIATLIEALLLAFVGGLLGILGTYLLFDGLSASTLGQGFTQIVFSFSVTRDSATLGMVSALAIGFFGGLIPAIRSAYVPLLAVHRS